MASQTIECQSLPTRRFASYRVPTQMRPENEGKRRRRHYSGVLQMARTWSHGERARSPAAPRGEAPGEAMLRGMLRRSSRAAAKTGGSDHDIPLARQGETRQGNSWAG